MKAFILKSPIISFLLITFSITFSMWFLPVWIQVSQDVAMTAMLVGGCGPMLAAYVITAMRSNAKIRIHSKLIFAVVFLLITVVLYFRLYFLNEGIPDGNGFFVKLEVFSPMGFVLAFLAIFLLAFNASNATNPDLKENYIRTFLFEPSKWKWYIVAFLLLPAIPLLSYVLGKLSGLETTDYLLDPKPLLYITFFSTFFFLGGNEEFGWRGFMQKEMQKRHNPLVTALIISFFWSLWHLPLHYNGLYSTGGIVDLLPRFIWMIPLTLIYSWLYNKSRYSILAVVILHAVTNNLGNQVGYSEIWLYIVIGLLMVFCVVNDRMWIKKDYPIDNSAHTIPQSDIQITQ